MPRAFLQGGNGNDPLTTGAGNDIPVGENERSERLRREGCVQERGYFVGRPQPASDIAKMLERERAAMAVAA